MNGLVEYSTPVGTIRKHEVLIGKTISEIMVDLEIPVNSFPIVCVMNGKPVLRKDWSTEISEKDEICFIQFPRGGQQGGGIKSIFRIVALISLAVVAPFAAGLIGGALGVTSAIGIGLIQAGIVLAGGFLINALFPIKSPSQQQTTEASPTYNLSAQGNQARLLSPIPRLYGRHIIYPDFCSQPYTEYVGNEQYLYQLFCLGLGQYNVEEIRIEDTSLWNSTSGFTGNFDDVQIQIINPGQTVTLIPLEVLISGEVGGQELDTDWTGPFVGVPANRQADRLSVDIVFQNGLGYANDSGRISNFTVTVVVEARLIDIGGSPAGSWVQIGSHSYTLATATAQRFTNTYDVSLGRYDVRVRRAEAKNTESRYLNTVVWEGLRCQIPDDATYPDVTLLAIKMRATNQLTQTSSRRFNVIQTAKVPVWNGSSWTSPQATRNPAWAIADVLRNTVYGASLVDTRIDIAKLASLAATWDTRGDKFDGVFDTKRSIWDAISSIAIAGRAQPVLIAGVVSFFRDEPRSIARGVFTSRNIVKNTFESTHILYDENSPDDVIVEFLDERTWRQNEVQCTLDGSLSDSPARIQMFGVVGRTQAWREGMYKAAVNAYRRTIASITSEMEGRLLIKGDPIIVSHDIPFWAYSGEVIGADLITGELILSDETPFTEGQNHYILLRRKDGKEFGPILCTKTDYGVLLDEEDLSATVSVQGKTLSQVLQLDPSVGEVTTYVFGAGESYAKRFLLATGTSRGFEQVQLTMTNDDPRVYSADQGSPPSESDGTGISNPSAPEARNLMVVANPNSTGEPLLVNASWQPAAGAQYYILQISYDNVTWSTVYEGAASSTQTAVLLGTVYFRVAAINEFRGPWATFSTSFGSASASPSTVSGLLASIPSTGDAINVQWGIGARATSYLVEVYSESTPDSGTYDILEISRSVGGTAVQFNSSDIVSAGGPWSAVQVRVTSVNSFGSSSPATYTLTGYQLNPISGLSLVTSYKGTELQVQWFAVANATQYRVDIKVNGSLVRSFMIMSIGFIYTSAQIAEDGGPWRQITVDVQAQNRSIVSPIATITTEISDLTNFWRFEGSGADSAGSSGLSFSGGAAIVSDSQRGQVLEVSGDDERATTFATLSSSYTKSLWIKPATLIGEQYIVASAGSTDDRHALGMLDNALLSGHNGTFTAVGATLSNADEWYHVAITYDAATEIMKLYVNGTLISTSMTSPMTSSPAGMQVSGYQGAALAFDGRIDDVQIYSRALALDEVRATMR